MESVGSYLRHEREVRDVSLEEIAQTTRVPLRTLHLIEQDRFDQLPGTVFVRGFLRSYASSVGLPADDVLARYGEHEAPSEARPAPITAITPPERGRRFGIAIALVVVLILFTLALSIVLRPRRRATPVELSVHSLEADEPSAAG